MKNLIEKVFKNNHLFVNSFNLMFASGLSAAFGFLFWIIIAKSFSTATVGIATTLLSVATLLSLLGLAGFDSLFIRFLSKSKDPNEQINNGLIISGIASGIIASIFCLLLPILSPKLQIVLQSGWSILTFIIVTIFMTWNILTNAILIAYRRTSFVLAIDLIFSVVKICLPFLINTGGSMNIFIIVGIAQIVNVLLSLSVIIKFYNYIPSIRLSLESIKDTFHFGMTVYFSQILNLLPASALPIIVINNLGASTAAYYYIAFAISNLLYSITYTTSQVLTAEASHDEKYYMHHARKGLKLMCVILTPAILMTIIFCPFVLNIFGKNYGNNASGLLRMLAISGFAVMFYSILSFIFKQIKNLKGILAMNATNAFSIILLSEIFVTHLGLIGIGFAWLLGTVIATLVGFTALLISRKSTFRLSKTPKNIIISHVYSEDNKGDAALLSVLIKDIKSKYKKASITILTLDSIRDDETFENIPVKNSFMYYALNKFDNKPMILMYSIWVMIITIVWSHFYKATGISLPINAQLKNLSQLYAQADLILPVGGGYIRSQKKGIGSLLNVALLIHPLKIAHTLKKPTILYTQSIGPFTSSLEEKIVSHAINNYTQATIIRENISMELLDRIGANKNVYRSIDSGFAFTAEKTKYDMRGKLQVDSKKLVFGVTARNWLNQSAQTKYECAIAETVRYIVTKYNAAVVFIPQVTAEFHGDDDRNVHKRIYKYVEDLPNVYTIDEKLNHRQIKAAYDSLDLVIGTRFHSVIFSLTSYVPAIAIEYEHKTGGIMHDLDLDKWVIKMENVNAKNLSRMVETLIAERKVYKQHLQNILPHYIEKTNEPIQIVKNTYDRYTNKPKTGEKRVRRINIITRLRLPFIKKAYQAV